VLDHEVSAALHRIGSVSRVAGVPVSTLRMWEGRHAAFAPTKTEGRHRLYSEDDVLRARLLRQLTEAGHSIGGIARLAAAQLQELLVQSRSADAQRRAPAAPRRLCVVVVGTALAARITSARWQHLLGDTVLEIRRIYRTIEEALAADPSALHADVLLARTTALQPGADAQLLQLLQQLQARHAILLYSFGAAQALGALRERGFLLRREPVEDGELAQLVRSMTWAGAPQPGPAQEARAAIPARRYSDDDLTQVATSPTEMLCECPRHIADIIGQLASFEEYSARCLNHGDEDAQVHAYLRSVSGSARALFEDALDRVLAHNARAG
jgi:DNA-binding transcriptional MerR regulator